MATCRKICMACSAEFEHPIGKHGRICKPCKNTRQRLSRRANRNTHTRHYEKTPKGFIVRCYHNMERRLGKELLSRDVFYAWARIDPDFMALFRDWTLAGWPQRLTPSIGRIDPRHGHTPDNMRWITHSENSRLGGRNPVRKAS